MRASMMKLEKKVGLLRLFCIDTIMTVTIHVFNWRIELVGFYYNFGFGTNANFPFSKKH